MANLPTPKSYNQILGEMLASYMARIGVNDLQTGSVVTSLFEAVAQSVYRSSGDIFQIIRDFSVDRAEGEALKRIATEERIKILPAQVATGTVTITDTSFEKIATKVYAGDVAPNIGSTVIKVSDASKFPASGQLYIGRGTPNVEGPISYSAVTPVGSFYEITLSTPTTKFHNISESVILAQGGVRNIPVATSVKTVGTGGSNDIIFSTTKSVIILDGENQITAVPVAAQEPGADGNVSRNSIKEFVIAPFIGAVVSNPSPFTTGRNEESDDEIRAKIKRARISRGLGTALSVKNATLGAVAKDENATVTSNEIFSVGTDTTVLYVDNGSGYEEKSNGVGLEYIVDSALGGESYFQLATGGQQTSVAKAFIESVSDGPFAVYPNYKLSLLIGGFVSEHVFGSSDFRAPGAATAYEISASVNANSDLLFYARTSNEGKRVVFFSKEEQNEYIQTSVPAVGVNAAPLLFLPENRVDTLKLYKNKKPLAKDGIKAFLQTADQSTWSETIISGETLNLKVDGTSFINYTFTDADFQAEGSHVTVSKNNTLSSWANVINAKVIGATATVTGTKINLTSNLGANTRAKLEIDPFCSFVTKGIFSSANPLSAQGSQSDFSLSRNTAQIKLTDPLAKGDSLSAGTDFSKAFIQSLAILGGSFSIANDAYLWFVIDNQNAQKIVHGAISDTFLDIQKPATNIVRYVSSQSTAFSNVQVGDYVIIWSSEVDPNNRLEGRVNAVTSNTFDIKVTSAEYISAQVESGIVMKDGIVFIRTDKAPQKVKLPAGSYTVNQVSNLFNSTINGVICSVENDEILIIASNTESTQGCVYLPTYNTEAKSLNLTINDKQVAGSTLFAFYETLNSEGEFPLVHEKIASDSYADVPDAEISQFISASSFPELEEGLQIVNFLHPYGEVKDAQGAKETVQVSSLVGTQINIDEEKIVRRLRSDDRFFLTSPFIFAHNDNLVITLDSDPVNKTFDIPIYRKAKANATAPISANNIRAYDIESGETASFANYFGSFDFKNFKALMKARNAMNPKLNTVNEDSILFRSAIFGAAGEKYRISYKYPVSANSPLSSTVIVTDTVDISILLKSGNLIANTVDSTTEWNIAVSTNTPIAGVDEVTYVWSGVGTTPNISAVSPNSYITINGNGEFNPENQGTFKVISSTNTSFTVHRPNGVASVQSNVATLTTDTMSFFESSSTTAKEIFDYIASDLSNWISAELLNDNGTTGSGVIDTSTYEDSGFTQEFLELKDGYKIIASSDLSAIAPNPQFIFSTPLQLPSISTANANSYSFANGEEFVLVPTTAKQVKSLISVLAVSGYTTLGKVSLSSNDSKVQFISSILGNSGAVQVAGGSANSVSTPITSSASKINGKMLVSVDSALAQSSTSGWFRVEAQNYQRKDTGISNATNVTIVPNYPIAGYSKITLENREAQDTYFGKARNNIRADGRAFHVEKHGKLICLSWDTITGSDPAFSKLANLNDASGGDISVFKNTATGLTEYTAVSPRNFSELDRGNILTITGFANTENNGTFNVIGVSSDKTTVVVDNFYGVTESAVNIPNGDISVISTIKEGDTLELGYTFATLNRGKFRVIKVYGSSVYFENSSAVEERVVVSATYRSLSGDVTTEYDVINNGDMRIEWNGMGTQPDFSSVKMGDIAYISSIFSPSNLGEFMVTKVGDTFIELANANAVAESGVLGNAAISISAPSIKSYPYDASVALDRFVISSDVLGSGNQGIFTINEILDENNAIVNGILSPVSSVNLGVNYLQAYVEEGEKYYSYKYLETVAVDPSSSQNTIFVFNSSENFSKINDSADIIISAACKLNLPEGLVKGTDSYRYNTGLIAEVNRILYGDPRDSTTYPGVAAAGAEIFSQAPLFRRINVSVDVRVNTGIPFTRVTEQVRNNVAALINSSPIGQAIAISDIISVVNSITGVKAVAISFPDYSAINDVIAINPAEKPIVIDASQDIIVSKNG